MADIDVSSILLNDTVPDEMHPTEIGDYDDNGIPDLMVKFDRAEVVQYILNSADVDELLEDKFLTTTLIITGTLDDGTLFQGSDTIKVILPKGKGGPRFPKHPLFSSYE